MADRIGVMADGALIAEGTLDELRRQAGSGHASLEDTFLALVAQNRRASRGHDRGVSRPGTIGWFALHEARLAWRDWLSLMTGGHRRRGRTVALGFIAFVLFVHGLAYLMLASSANLCRHGRHAQSWWSSPARWSWRGR